MQSFVIVALTCPRISAEYCSICLEYVVEYYFMFTLLTRMATKALNSLLSTISKGRNLENEMEINNRRKMKTLWIDLVLVKAASMVC